MTPMKAMIIIALTMALFITIATTSFNVNRGEEENIKTNFAHAEVENELVLPSKRVSRFLAEDLKNPRAADHCNKDNQVCSLVGGYNTTCCNNKCIDLAYDNKNCGACKNKCKYTETCCRGVCVNVAYDKRHCGKCNNRCRLGEYCVYSMCNYA